MLTAHRVILATVLGSVNVLLLGCTPGPPSPGLASDGGQTSPPPATGSETPEPSAVHDQAPLITAQTAAGTAVTQCALLRDARIRITPLWVNQGEVLRDDSYDWSALDRELDGLAQCDIEAALHVQLRTSRERPEQVDLAAYERFLRQLVTHLDGRVTRYSIENEPNSVKQWPGTPESYFELLALASRTIHEIDPKAVVQNGGVASASLALARVADLYRGGDMEAALTLAQQTLRESPSGGPDRRVPESPEELELLLATEDVRRAVAWVALEVANQDAYDVFQMHYYGPWQNLAPLIEWVRSQGIDKPIEAWELGRRYKGQTPFSDENHANEMVKLLTVAAGEGLRLNTWVRATDWDEKDLPGLFSPAGEIHPAYGAFVVLAEQLEGAREPRRADLGPDVWAYQFTRDDGEVLVLWSESGEDATATIPDPAQATLLTLGGARSPLEGPALTVDERPVIVVIGRD